MAFRSSRLRNAGDWAQSMFSVKGEVVLLSYLCILNFSTMQRSLTMLLLVVREIRQILSSSKTSIRSSGAQCRSIFLTLRDQIFQQHVGGDSFQGCESISGFSVVPEKDGIIQRKLMMSCSFNYLLTPVEERYRLGMDAGGNINRLHTDGSSMCVAASDQSKAFTRVAVPSWVTRSNLVCPVYMRLPEFTFSCKFWGEPFIIIMVSFEGSV